MDTNYFVITFDQITQFNMTDEIRRNLATQECIIISQVYQIGNGSQWAHNAAATGTQRNQKVLTIWDFGETYLEFNFHEISTVHNIHFSWLIALKFGTKHDSITAALSAKFQNEKATE